MPEQLIRAASAEDLPILLRFEQAVINAERPFALYLKEGNIHYYNLPKFIECDNTHLVILEIDGQAAACGYAQIRASDAHHNSELHAYLGFMYTIENHRGQGLNQTIIKHLQDWSLSRGVRHFRLDVFTQNEAAIRAYAKSGFQQHMTEMVMEL